MLVQLIPKSFLSKQHWMTWQQESYCKCRMGFHL